MRKGIRYSCLNNIYFNLLKKRDYELLETTIKKYRSIRSPKNNFFSIKISSFHMRRKFPSKPRLSKNRFHLNIDPQSNAVPMTVITCRRSPLMPVRTIICAYAVRNYGPKWRQGCHLARRSCSQS